MKTKFKTISVGNELPKEDWVGFVIVEFEGNEYKKVATYKDYRFVYDDFCVGEVVKYWLKEKDKDIFDLTITFDNDSEINWNFVFGLYFIINILSLNEPVSTILKTNIVMIAVVFMVYFRGFLNKK